MFAWKQQSFKECVTAHWSSEAGIDNKRASSIVPKFSQEIILGRRAFCSRRRCSVSYAGADRKANVGISSDNVCENHTHRKTKDSSATSIN